MLPQGVWSQAHFQPYVFRDRNDALHDHVTARGSVPDDLDEFLRFMHHEIESRSVLCIMQMAGGDKYSRLSRKQHHQWQGDVEPVQDEFWRVLVTADRRRFGWVRRSTGDQAGEPKILGEPNTWGAGWTSLYQWSLQFLPLMNTLPSAVPWWLLQIAGSFWTTDWECWMWQRRSVMDYIVTTSCRWKVIEIHKAHWDEPWHASIVGITSRTMRFMSHTAQLTEIVVYLSTKENLSSSRMISRVTRIYLSRRTCSKVWSSSTAAKSYKSPDYSRWNGCRASSLNLSTVMIGRQGWGEQSVSGDVWRHAQKRRESEREAKDQITEQINKYVRARQRLRTKCWVWRCVCENDQMESSQAWSWRWEASQRWCQESNCRNHTIARERGRTLE